MCSRGDVADLLTGEREGEQRRTGGTCVVHLVHDVVVRVDCQRTSVRTRRLASSDLAREGRCSQACCRASSQQRDGWAVRGDRYICDSTKIGRIAGDRPTQGGRSDLRPRSAACLDSGISKIGRNRRVRRKYVARARASRSSGPGRASGTSRPGHRTRCSCCARRSSGARGAGRSRRPSRPDGASRSGHASRPCRSSNGAGCPRGASCPRGSSRSCRPCRSCHRTCCTGGTRRSRRSGRPGRPCRPRHRTRRSRGACRPSGTGRPCRSGRARGSRGARRAGSSRGSCCARGTGRSCGSCYRTRSPCSARGPRRSRCSRRSGGPCGSGDCAGGTRGARRTGRARRPGRSCRSYQPRRTFRQLPRRVKTDYARSDLRTRRQPGDAHVARTVSTQQQQRSAGVTNHHRPTRWRLDLDIRRTHRARRCRRQRQRDRYRQWCVPKLLVHLLCSLFTAACTLAWLILVGLTG